MKPYYEDTRAGIVIYHGDCREVLPQLEAASIDLVVADPIYGVSMPGVKHEGRPGDGARNFDFFANDTPSEAIALAKSIVKECDRLLKPHGSGYAWLSHRQFAELTIDLELRGWKTRFLVWSKSCPPPPPPGSGWPSAAELCLYWFRDGRRWTHDGIDYPRSNVLIHDAYRYGKPGKVNHPTQKPLGCMATPVVASSQPGDLVLDPSLGSGTTARVCKDLGRRCIGIELEERYCEIAANRLRQEVLF